MGVHDKEPAQNLLESARGRQTKQTYCNIKHKLEPSAIVDQNPILTTHVPRVRLHHLQLRPHHPCANQIREDISL